MRLWVHIADVSAYVRPGGALDGEAFRRGCSVYVPGAVEPMLPDVLSSDVCSLRPGEDRLAVTVQMELSGASVEKVEFHRSLIRSDARLTYPQVDAVFEGSERAEEPWAEPLALARAVASELAARRDSLEVASAEPSFEFDEQGRVTGVHAEEQTESHGLIEQLMVLANEQVAGYLADRRLPTLYRVHEKPDPSAVAFMIEQLASLEVPTPPLPKQMSPQQAAEVAAESSRLAAEYARNSGRGRHAFGTLVLRSLKQAFYTPKNLGHAGLGSERYCHFTSPIRRYPDLVAHRALLQGLGIDDAAAPAHELDEAGIVSSAAEREAMAIERDADDVCLAFLLERELSEHDPAEPPAFEGEVVGLIAAGAFVRFGRRGPPAERGLRGHASGAPPARLVGAQRAGHRARLGDSSRELRLGDPVEVAVSRVDAPRGRVDLTSSSAQASLARGEKPRRPHRSVVAALALAPGGGRRPGGGGCHLGAGHGHAQLRQARGRHVPRLPRQGRARGADARGRGASRGLWDLLRHARKRRAPGRSRSWPGTSTRDGEPEVVVSLYTGGAHCCTISTLYGFQAATGDYRRVRRNWRDAGFRLRDIGRDGSVEFDSRDARFAYAFASYAESFLPLQIFRYRARPARGRDDRLQAARAQGRQARPAPLPALSQSTAT